MENTEALSLEQIQAFWEASQRQEIYGWMTRTLCHQEYWKQKREAKGLLRQIARHQKEGQVKECSYRRNRFVRRYTAADIELLGAVDEAHETLSGPATQKILYREFFEYGDERYQRLSAISVPHIYNLRRVRHIAREGSPIKRPDQCSCPSANGGGRTRKANLVTCGSTPCHQGDLEGAKGLYHINAVDEVSQFQVVGATAYISEAWLIPVLKAMLWQFPFRILGFHSANGSEFINHRVADLLTKLLVEQTKSRPRHSNDNGLVEAKNGAVIRKHMGYGHIASEHAQAIEAFYQRHFNPYLNFHRPCGVPEIRTNAKGKQRRMYRWYATPWEILRQIPNLARHLKPEITVSDLERMASARSDTQAAGYAGSQTKAVCRTAAEEERMKPTAVEMTGYGRGGKPKAGFPPRPQLLGNRKERDSHIPTAATGRGKVENEKHVSHFPACCL